MKLTITLLSFFIFTHSSLASFDNKRLRHFGPLDVLQVINKRFPVSVTISDPNNPIENNLPECQKFESVDINILGVSSPLSGNPIQNEPQTVFMNWYFSCLNVLSELHFKGINEKSDLTALAEFLPEDIIKRFESYKSLTSSSWTSLNPKDQEKIILYQIEQAIGPEEVLKDLKSEDTYALKTSRILKALATRDSETILENLRWIAIVTLMQPESLRY